MSPKITRCLAVLELLCSFTVKSQSVGIGTETPNPNAILELVAPDNNQGLLVPRISTTERTSSAFTNNLSASDNGLMIYDEDQNKFFFWINSQWVELATGNLSGLPDQAGQSGKVLTTDGSSALWTNIDFNSLENIPIGLSDGDNVDDADADPSNEIQDISSSGTAGNISLSSGSTLNLNVDDADADASNEFQDLTLSGSTLSLTNSVSTVDLSPFTGTNTDNQTLGLTGSNLSITGGNTIDISSINTNLSEAEVDAFVSNNAFLTSEVDGSISNELNTGMTLSGTTIQVTDPGGTQSVNIGGTFATDAELAASDAADGDKDGSNEFQDLTLSGSTLSMTNSTVNIDLAPFSGTNTDNQTLSLSGSDLSITGGNSINISSINTNLSETEVDAFANNNGYLTSEVDGSTSNEIQTISRSGTTLTLSNSGGSVSVADNDNSTTNEIQNLSVATDVLSLSGSAATVDLSVYLDDTNLTEAEVDAFANNNGYLMSEVDGSTSNEIQTISRSGTTLTLSNSGGSVSVADNDNSTTNEIQNLSVATDVLSLSGSAATVDLSVYLDDTNLTEAEVDAFANNNGYLTAEVDGSTSNEIQTISRSGTTLTLSNSGGSVSVADNDNSTTNEIQNLSVATDVLSLSGSAATVDLSVYLDDTNLTEAEVDAFANNNGYLTAEVDGSISNEIQTISRSGTTLTLSNSGGSVSVADNDNSTTNEIQNLSIATDVLSLSGSATTVDLSVYLDDTNLTEAEVDAFANNNGYLTSEVDGSISNEIQTISRSGTTLTLSNSGGSVSVADNDNSASNEFNTGMSLSGTTIRVTDGGGTQSVNIGGTFATDSELDSRTFNPSAFKATLSKNGTIPVGVSNLVFDSEVYDIDGAYDPSGTYNVPEDGFYNFGGLLIFQNNPTGLVQILITDGGTTTYYSKSFAPNTIQSSISFSVDLRLTAGDKIGVTISNTTFGGEAQPIQTIASPDQSNFFFCGKRFN